MTTVLGASLVNKASSAVLQSWSEVPARIQRTGLRVDGAVLGWEDDTFILVERVTNDDPPADPHSIATESDAFDGTKVVADRTYTILTDVIAEKARVASIKADAGRVDLLDRLRTAAPAQIDAWIDSNVTTIAAARAVLKAIIKVIALDART